MTSETVVQVPTLPSEPVEKREAIIRTQGLTKKFGAQVAVKDVTFEVPRGKIFGFIGPSGSGKTTTIRMLTGYYHPTEGEVFVFDTPPVKFSESQREKIGYMPQLFVLYPNLSVWENMNFAASIYGMSFWRRKKLKELLDFVELAGHRHKIAREISGGMQRRLTLAATLVHDPELIFLDEPTAGVDPVLRSKFWDHFRNLRDQGRTLFVTTQYVSEAAYCDLVAVMGEGVLLMVDTPKGLRYRAFGGDVVELRTAEPVTPRLQALLQEQPFVKGKVERLSANDFSIVVDEAKTAIPALMDWSRNNDLEVQAVEEFLPPFDDVFVQLVKEERENAA